jgi:hypothetical protein
MRTVRRLGVSTLALSLAALCCAAASAWAEPLAQPVGWGPLTSKEAAKLVDRDPDFEPRPSNAKENRTVPPRKWIRQVFRKRSDMPYARFVDGRFKGTTDEIIQWAAYKWGFDPNLLRAVATHETYWDMNVVGNEGSAFGLFQVRRPWHCCLPYTRDSTAFNADYYGGIMRAYYDGAQDWLNNPDVVVNRPDGILYEPGDVWGSVGAWVSGNWHLQANEDYVDVVQKWLDSHPWRTDQWFAEPWYKPHPE